MAGRMLSVSAGVIPIGRVLSTMSLAVSDWAVHNREMSTDSAALRRAGQLGPVCSTAEQQCVVLPGWPACGCQRQLHCCELGYFAKGLWWHSVVALPVSLLLWLFCPLVANSHLASLGRLYIHACSALSACASECTCVPGWLAGWLAV